jgi:hypothetical protein
LTLKPSEFQAFYDRFGRVHDTQSFFEDRAIEELIEYARFTEVEHVFEFGAAPAALRTGACRN